MINRNFTDRSKKLALPVYKSFVRPHLEYFVSVWKPYLCKGIKLLSDVNRPAAKLIEGIGNWSKKGYCF